MKERKNKAPVMFYADAEEYEKFKQICIKIGTKPSARLREIMFKSNLDFISKVSKRK